MAVATDVGNLVAKVATTYVGLPSAPHTRFHTGINFAKGHEPNLTIDSRAEEQLLAWLAGSKLEGYWAHKYEVHLPHSAETGLDCSGLANLVMQEVLERLGIAADVPRHVKGFYIWALTSFVPIGSLRTGDLLFSHRRRNCTPPDHLSIYLCGGEIVSSQATKGGNVKLELLETVYDGLVAAKRLRL